MPSTRSTAKPYEEVGDPETLTRISQYEMAFRMQMHASEAFDLKDEPEHVHKLYGTAPGKESFANNCLLARRLAERGVRYIQLFHWGWDSHGASKNEALDGGFQDRCRETDQAMSALLTDLKQRGLLEDTLVVWGGEFGSVPPCRKTAMAPRWPHVGRDHNPSAFTMWMAGGGIKPGISYGETDPIGYSAVQATRSPPRTSRPPSSTSSASTTTSSPTRTRDSIKSSRESRSPPGSWRKFWPSESDPRIAMVLLPAVRKSHHAPRCYP